MKYGQRGKIEKAVKRIVRKNVSFIKNKLVTLTEDVEKLKEKT